MHVMVRASIVGFVMVGLVALADPRPCAQQARPASPPGTAAIQVGGTYVKANETAAPRYTGGKWIEITYSRPILRGRQQIFGVGADYGKAVSGGVPVWRAGANQTTRLKTEVPLVVAGKTIPAGEYSLFVELKPNAWTLVISSQPHQEKYDKNDKTATWGSDNYDPAKDVVRVPMAHKKVEFSMEQFTIAFIDVTDRGGKIAMWWGTECAAAAFTVGS